jgi:hypothetical protein
LTVNDAINDLISDPASEYHTWAKWAPTGNAVVFNAPIADAICEQIEDEWDDYKFDVVGPYMLTWERK